MLILLTFRVIVLMDPFYSLLGTVLTCRSLRSVSSSWNYELTTEIFQQIIYNNAQQIAATYPSDTVAQYQAAATTLRIPYWDWARNATMPDVTNQPKITIHTPTGTQLIDNPLYTYTFHPRPSTSDFPTSESVSSHEPNVFSNTLQPPKCFVSRIVLLKDCSADLYAGHY